MPSVPFTGVPTISPSIPDTPRYTADTPPAAFGTNIAQAVEGLGKTAEGVGNEIFARGIAMQDLYNHSEAQAGDAAYMQKAGELHADYSSKQGKDAVDAYPQYIKDLQTARTQQRDQLSNPMSQKLYDSSSLSTMGRTIFNGAGHAATQNKVYAIGSSKARVAAMGDQALANPADDDAFQDNVQDTEDEVRAQGQLQGWGPDQTNEAVAKTTSGLWGQRIQGLVKTNPLAADKMLKGAIEDGSVQGEDIAKLSNLVQANNHTVGARMISHEVMTGAGNKWGEGTVDIKQAATALGQIESGGNYSAIGVQTKHGQALGKYQVMEEFLPEFLAKAGLPPMSRDEFIKNHSAQDQVFASNFGAYMKQTGSANDAASMWLTGKPLAEAGTVADAHGTNAQMYVSRFNNELAKGAPLSAQTDMGARLATERAPDDPLLPDFVRDRISADHNKQTSIQRDDNFQNRQVIETALMGGKDGKLPSSVEELTADSQAGAAWDQLVQRDPAGARRYMSVLSRNAKGDHAWTDASLRSYQQYKGQAQADPASFIDEDVISSDLPNSAKRELINLQGSLKGKAEGDPRVAQALGILAPDLQAAGLSKSGSGKDDYYQFVGALADQLEQSSQENKRPPKADEIKTIGARLLQAQSYPGRFFGTNQSPMFQVPVPSEEAEKIKADPAWAKIGITPSEQQVQRIYTRKQFQELYGGTPKSQASNGGKVPVSQ